MRNVMRNILPLLLVASAATLATAAEVRVRSEAGCSGAIVLLGDVAEIHANDAARSEALAAVELFPAPPRGTVRQMPLRELQELLYLRGIDTSDCRFFGASTTTIVAGAAVPGELPQVVNGAQLRSTAEARLAEAISSYLEVVAADEGGSIEWQVKLSLAPQYAALFADSSCEVIVQGGEYPWRGRQSFSITLLQGLGAAQVGAQEFAIDVDVKAMTQVVVATQALVRGQQVSSGDVRLASFEAGNAPGGLLVTPEEAVGLEVSSNVSAGRPIRAADLRAPRLVLRNDQVMLVVRRGGVVVRSQAKALDDGSLGEMIEVQSLVNRERFVGRVVAPGLIELGGPVANNR